MLFLILRRSPENQRHFQLLMRRIFLDMAGQKAAIIVYTLPVIRQVNDNRLFILKFADQRAYDKIIIVKRIFILCNLRALFFGQDILRRRNIVFAEFGKIYGNRR